MTQTKNCSRCGVQLVREGNLAGLCPACMLAGHAAEAGSGGPAARSQGPDLDQVRQRFDELEVLELVGRGGMGFVYKARQSRLDRLVALKILAPELAADPTFAERFLREARALAKLSHPNVVAVHDFGERAGMYYLLMEYVDGTGLREIMQSGELEPSAALAIVPQICAGLQYAHEQGVVHRDIKPENILLDSRGQVKIADFGLAKLLGTNRDQWTLTRSSQVMGTPHYMAPEQIQHPLEVDHRADIYSLGVVFYEMLTSELPVGLFSPPSQKVGVDVRLDEVVLKTLEREPERRYQKASQVGTEVEAIAQDGGTSRARLEAAPVAPPGASWWPSWPTQVPGGALVVAAGCLFLSLTWFLLFETREVNRHSEWLTPCYVLAFMALSVVRRPASSQHEVAWGNAFKVVCFLGAAAMATALSFKREGGVPALAFEYVASATLVFGHLLYDQWVRFNRWQALGAAAILVLLATTMHVSQYRHTPEQQVYYYPSGMMAVLSVSSCLALLPEYFLQGVDRRVHHAILRGLGVGSLAAAFYFAPYLGLV